MDDNARALIADDLSGGVGPRARRRRQGSWRRAIWLSSSSPSTAQEGRFRNFLSFDRDWLEEVGSEDSHGRALWALGHRRRALARRRTRRRRQRALRPRAARGAGLYLPRAWAFTLLGIDEYLKRFGERSRRAAGAQGACQPADARFEAARTTDWLWFEDELTYDNATLPRALLLAGAGMGKQKYVAVALTSLKWLMEVQRPRADYFVPIGCNGFYPVARNARASISSRWRRSRRWPHASTPTVSQGTRTGARRRR